MNINRKNAIVKFFVNRATRFNPERYWKWRNIVIDRNNGVPKFIKLVCLYYVKRTDAFHNASMGTDINFGADFAIPPILMHGLNGIVVSHYAVIGRNCHICQHATIAQSLYENVAPVIGNDVFIGVGAVIYGNVKIGDGATIGANSVVTHDVPAGSFAAGVPAKIIKSK